MIKISNLSISVLPMMRLSLFVIGAIFILAGGMLLAGGAAEAAPPAQAPDTPPSVTGGQLLWAENCQPCHGATGQGDGPTAESIPNPIPNFTDPQVSRSAVPVTYFEIIKNGRMANMMPPWGNQLTDDQIWDAAAYVWSLSVSAQDLAVGETVYLEQCAACHGESGAGDGPQAPAEIVDFTNLETMVQRSQADLQAGFLASDPHAEFLDLPEEDLWQALAHIRTFSYDLAVPEGEGTLTGQVINATTGEPVGEVEVILHVFQNEAEIETRTTQTDSEGNYLFEDLPTEHSIFYVVEGEYNGLPYLSDEPGIFLPNETETTLNLKVYESTSDDAAIYVTQLHYLLAFTPETVNAVQVFVVGNRGDQTYVGQNGQTFDFGIPLNAVGVTFQGNAGGTRFIPTDTGYADTAPIPPGEEGSTIVASYDIPYEDDELTIELPMPADIDALNVLMSNQGADLSSDQVEFVSTREAQGSEFAIFNGSNLAEGEVLTLQLSDLDNLEFAAAPASMPGATAPGPPVNQAHVRWIMLGLGGLAIVALGVGYPLMRPRLTHQAELHDDDPDRRRQKLLLMLARLDQAFEAGELDETVYRRARARYKAELAEVMEG